MSNATELTEVCRAIAEQAGPGEHVEVFARRARTFSVRAYEGRVEALESAEPAGVGVRVVVGQRLGFASCGTLDEGVLAETLAEARDNAAFAEPDLNIGLAEPDGVSAPQLELCRPELGTIPTEAKIELAIELERLVKAADRRITGVRTAVYEDSVLEEAVVTTTGISSWSRRGGASLELTALASDGGDTQYGSGFSLGRSPTELDVEACAREAAERATALLGARKPASGRATVVLDQGVAVGLLGVLGAMLSADAVQKGRSLFANRVGEAVATPGLTLIDDPTNAASPGASHHDGEGLARRRTVLIEGGVLRRYLHNSYTARRADAASTASAARGYASTPGVAAPALALVPSSQTQAELVTSVREGVFVQSVTGMHSGVNPVSGDFSVGATGRMIRGGSLAEPFREATVASTLQRMLAEVVAVGSEARFYPGGDAGSTLVIAEMALGGR